MVLQGTQQKDPAPRSNGKAIPLLDNDNEEIEVVATVAVNEEILGAFHSVSSNGKIDIKLRGLRGKLNAGL